MVVPPHVPVCAWLGWGHKELSQARHWYPFVVPEHVPTRYLLLGHEELSQALHTPLVAVPDPDRYSPVPQVGWARHWYPLPVVPEHVPTRYSLPAHTALVHVVQVPLLSASYWMYWPLGHAVHTLALP